MNPKVQDFYDPATFTFTYVVYDRDGGRAAIVDPVLDFDAEGKLVGIDLDHASKVANLSHFESTDFPARTTRVA